MEDTTLHIANFFFYSFHTVLIVFNLFGWLPARTRRLNLVTLLLTFGSWVLLGYWKGWGYCFLTDWHYDVLRRLGERELPSSYVAFLVNKSTGWMPPVDLVDRVTTISAILALLCSIYVNLRVSSRAQ